MPYTCEWERPDNPTASMTTTEMQKYYKEESVRGWCRFYLADPGDMSDGLRDAIRDLMLACGVKEKKAHRETREALSRQWRVERIARADNWQTVERVIASVRHLAYTPQTINFKPNRWGLRLASSIRMRNFCRT